MSKPKRKTSVAPRVRSSKPPISTAEFWAGAEGNAYTDRNRVEWQQRVPFWRHIQELTNAASFLEVGTNAGWNLRALRALNPEFSMSGIDLNEKALREAQAEGFDVEVMPGYKVAEFFGAGACDLAFTSGVLIHVGPDELVQTMAAIRDVSSQYVLAVEYDHPEIQEVEYRGHSGKLWKRPYGRLYEELGLSLVETGPAQGFNDCTYYLLEK